MQGTIRRRGGHKQEAVVPLPEKVFGLDMPLSQRFDCIWKHHTKGCDHRVHVLVEIIETEFNYIIDLQVCIEIFLNELRMREDIFKPSFQPQVFGNVEEILALHRDLFSLISSSLSSDRELSISQISVMIGEVFATAATDFISQYGQYCLSFYKGTDIMHELRTKQPLLNNLLEIQETHPRVNGLKLADYLIKPIQRICKYPLLFRELMQHDSEEDYTSLKETLSALTRVVELVNKCKREHDIKDRLRTIESSIDNMSLKGPFVKDGREMMKEGTLVKYNKMMRSQQRYCFLTNDILIYTKEKALSLGGKKYLFKGVILLESSVVSKEFASFKVQKNIEHGFQITQLAKKREYYFSASSERERDEWLEALAGITDNYRNADVRKSKALTLQWRELLAEEEARSRGARKRRDLSETPRPETPPQPSND